MKKFFLIICLAINIQSQECSNKNLPSNSNLRLENAIKQCNTTLVNILLKNKRVNPCTILKTINSLDNKNYQEYSSLFATLITHGANINATSSKKQNALHKIIIHSTNDNFNLAKAKALINMSDNLINQVDIYNETPIFYASNKGSLRAIQELLLHKPKLNIRGLNGLTPLMYAVNNAYTPNHAAITSALIDAGARTSICDHKGNDAVIHLLRRDYNHKEVKELIKLLLKTSQKKPSFYINHLKSLKKGIGKKLSQEVFDKPIRILEKIEEENNKSTN